VGSLLDLEWFINFDLEPYVAWENFNINVTGVAVFAHGNTIDWVNKSKEITSHNSGSCWIECVKSKDWRNTNYITSTRGWTEKLYATYVGRNFISCKEVAPIFCQFCKSEGTRCCYCMCNTKVEGKTCAGDIDCGCIAIECDIDINKCVRIPWPIPLLCKGQSNVSTNIFEVHEVDYHAPSSWVAISIGSGIGITKPYISIESSF